MKIIFAGTPEFSVPILQALLASKHEVCAVYTQPDRPSGRGRKVHISPVKQCALDNNVAVEQPLNFKNSNDIEQLTSYKADLMVVVAYGIILPENVLNTPALGCINIHASLLPRWRGAAPIQRALLAGDVITGITLMQMDEGLDTGDMLSRSTYHIQPNDTSATIHDCLSALGAQALMALLPSVENQILTPTQQINSEATYAAKLSKSEALIDWSQSGNDILRAICAFNPWPVSHTLLNDKPLRIWQARFINKHIPKPPGTICVDGHQLFIACVDGQLEIIELQPPNKRKMSTKDYLAAHNPNEQRLG
jgi:methionyl-tRNA formyltransferase